MSYAQPILLGVSGLVGFVIFKWYSEGMSLLPIGPSTRNRIDWSQDGNSCAKGLACQACGPRDYAIPATPGLCESKGWTYKQGNFGRPGCFTPTGGMYWPCSNPDVKVPNKVVV